ncbi:hypothetical protein HM1_1112 [Heliomicrobium modesticaldum Ice1]|uniref:Uncharacterized protein n=1 Tax=Heliobacterium modesticaldum (strain ATCC 51547 / Ice1) TaxID=498761 RepID=B0THM4_HELMI|nr:hypothetical protein HM1_1112 [Heliomicrobium modesticaldum Ice1]
MGYCQVDSRIQVFSFSTFMTIPQQRLRQGISRIFYYIKDA